MTGKILIISLLLFFCSCEARKSLNEPARLFYLGKDVSVEIELTSKRKSEWDNSQYLYYGVMTSKLLSVQSDKPHLLTKPTQVQVVYNGKKYKIYEDTKVDYDPIHFWSLDRWDSSGFRKNKVYIV